MIDLLWKKNLTTRSKNLHVKTAQTLFISHVTTPTNRIVVICVTIAGKNSIFECNKFCNDDFFKLCFHNLMSKVRNDLRVSSIDVASSIKAKNIVVDSITATSANLPGGNTLQGQISSFLSIPAHVSGGTAVTTVVDTDYLGNPFTGNNFIITGEITGIVNNTTEVVLQIVSPEISGGQGNGVNTLLTLGGSYSEASGASATELKQTESASVSTFPSFNTNADGNIRVRLSRDAGPPGVITQTFTLFVSTFRISL